MVITRRAAKAAAEAAAAKAAAAAAAAAAEAAMIAGEKEAAETNIQVIDADTPHPDLNLSHPRFPPQREREKPLASPNHRLKIGMYFAHVCALFAVLAAAHAAYQPAASPYPIHSVLLLLCTIPLRSVLALKLFQVTYASTISLGLSAPVLFSSNALHVLASRSDDANIRLYVAAAALQFSAAWLDMAVTAHEASLPGVREQRYRAFMLASALLDCFGDFFLAAVVADWPPVVDLFYALFCSRLFADALRIVLSSVSIFDRDELRKLGHAQSSKHSTIS